MADQSPARSGSTVEPDRAVVRASYSSEQLEAACRRIGIPSRSPWKSVRRPLQRAVDEADEAPPRSKNACGPRKRPCGPRGSATREPLRPRYCTSTMRATGLIKRTQTREIVVVVYVRLAGTSRPIFAPRPEIVSPSAPNPIPGSRASQGAEAALLGTDDLITRFTKRFPAHYYFTATVAQA
jgi:hypothetical protein